MSQVLRIYKDYGSLFRALTRLDKNLDPFNVVVKISNSTLQSINLESKVYLDKSVIVFESLNRHSARRLTSQWNE